MQGFSVFFFFFPFLQAFGHAPRQQLTLITADWLCTEQSGLRALPQSSGLLDRTLRPQMKSLSVRTPCSVGQTPRAFFAPALVLGFSLWPAELGFARGTRRKCLVSMPTRRCETFPASPRSKAPNPNPSDLPLGAVTRGWLTHLV